MTIYIYVICVTVDTSTEYRAQAVVGSGAALMEADVGDGGWRLVAGQKADRERGLWQGEACSRGGGGMRQWREAGAKVAAGGQGGLL